MNYIPDDYLERTYAGWLGKVVGIRLGSAIEGWTYEEINKIYGKIIDYIVDYKDYAADDDSNGPLFFIRALEDYTHTRAITSKEIGLTWLNYVAEGHGFFWWGGYGMSTEHTAYINLKSGIDAPRSGSIELNGLTCAEQIGGQIFIDCWGFVAPNNPELAAEYALKAASVSHDGNGKYGGAFVAACISKAYTATSILEVIEAGLKVIPENCDYVQIAHKVIDYYNKDIKKEWEQCFCYIKENFWNDRPKGGGHILINGALMVMSILYGEGNFSTTQSIINSCGFDTDCNAGNVGAILGVFVGIDGIEPKWYKPINDLMLASSVIGSLNITNLPENVNLFCSLGYKIAGEKLSGKLNSIINNESPKFHFEYPTSTHAFRGKSDVKNIGMILANTDEAFHSGKRSLKVIVNYMKTAQDVKIYHKTYYVPDDLHDTRYDPAFSPILYPGQSISAYVMNPTKKVVNACLYVKERNSGLVYRSEPKIMSEEWTQLIFKIPEIAAGLIQEAGIIINSIEFDIRKFYMYIDDFDFSGKPKYSIEFDKERLENFGQGRTSIHLEVSQFTYLNGFWELDGEYLSGSCSERGETYTGDHAWKDYNMELTLKPITGYNHNINFRVQGGIRSYALGLAEGNLLRLSKNDNGYITLMEIPYIWKHLESYTFVVELNGNGIIIKDIKNNLLMSYYDNNTPYLYGQVGMSVLNGSHCHYKNLKIF